MKKKDELDILLGTLYKMIKIRVVELYIARRYPEQKMRCPVHLCLGQEAVPAVFGSFAKQADIFIGTCRSHGHYIAKGGDLKALFAEVLGAPQGCSGGFGGSMHIIDLDKNFWGTSAIVAGGVPIAAGAALSLKYRKSHSIVVAFLGDAATEEGVVYETVNFTLLHNLPILFVCENNRLAITTPIELRQSSSDIYNRFQDMGMTGYKVEENNIDELIEIAYKGYEYVRNGNGPCFIEYSVSRWCEHVGYKFKGPVDLWWQDPASAGAEACPICVLINKLIAENLLDLQRVNQLKQAIEEEIKIAFEQSEAEYVFSKLKLADYVYSSGLESELPRQNSHIDIEKFKYKEQSKLVNPF